MRFFVTGNSNQLAIHTLALLSGAGHDVTYYAKWKGGFMAPPGVRTINGDLDELPYQKSELSGKEFDAVICLNLYTLQNANAVLETFWNNARSFVVASSGNVYRAHGRFHGSEPGKINLGPLGENSPLRARELKGNDIYDKVIVEKRFTESEKNVTFLRFAPLYGVEDTRFRFLPFMRRMLDGRKEIPLGELQADWKWTHGYVGDAAYAVALAAENPVGKSRIYNVGEKETPTVVERIAQIASILDWKGEIVITDDYELAPHLQMPGNFHQHWIYDSKLIRKELKYHEQTDYQDGLEWSVLWYAEKRPKEVVGEDYSYSLEDIFLDEVR